MNVEQLRIILAEYPMSMRLVVTVEKRPLLETTVVEMTIKLMKEPLETWVAFFGRRDCIIRECVKEPLVGEKARREEWLEMDMR